MIPFNMFDDDEALPSEVRLKPTVSLEVDEQIPENPEHRDLYILARVVPSTEFNT